jgi:hypothetical protein
MRDPRPERHGSGDLGDDRVGNAQEHEVGARIRLPAVGDAQAALPQSRAHGTAGPTGPDDVDVLEHAASLRR